MKSPHGIASIFLLIALAAAALSQEASKSPRLHVDQSVMSALILTKVAPIYPPLARQARIQGQVTLNVDIGKSGDVTDMQLISGHPMLAPAAIAAVKQWKYAPYEVNQEPVEVETNVIVSFRMADTPATPGESTGNIATGPQGGVYGSVVSSPPVPGSPNFPKRIRVSRAVMQSMLVRHISPAYPPDARDQHIQGTVLLGVNIDKEGNAYKVELISGHPLLAPAAMEAVRQWKFKPYLLNGEPIEVETTATVNFVLEKEETEGK